MELCLSTSKLLLLLFVVVLVVATHEIVDHLNDFKENERSYVRSFGGTQDHSRSFEVISEGGRYMRFGRSEPLQGSQSADANQDYVSSFPFPVSAASYLGAGGMDAAQIRNQADGIYGKYAADED
ncbi:hypothetical protein HELRODRAFT_169729 [Helobdella robusta]|uniref:Uncharacterized protein n=1 Tax=Helobdella robusta TaxID=6412 RepID=T1F2A1_HELRO|nr:hypothetical protein HELRODRAFT_169729 [Helobdella robusta]ESO08007.1 hypothetical protein HELRODRAFT_169729 [Helobdella robusta]